MKRNFTVTGVTALTLTLALAAPVAMGEVSVEEYRAMHPQNNPAQAQPR